MKLFLALAVAVAATLCGAGPASAKNGQGCVDRDEIEAFANVVGSGHYRGLTRTTLERRWDAQYFGEREIKYLGSAKLYRRCGSTERDAWFAVDYRRGGGIGGYAYGGRDFTL